MKIKSTIAAIAAVSSSVLVFGQTTFAAGPNINMPPQNFNPGNQIQIPQMPQAPAMPQMPQMPVLGPQGLPVPPVPVATQQSQPASKPQAKSTSNTYVKGTCTWYVKEKRPDLPNGLGNGGQWVKNAAKRGFKTGTSPAAGAVGEQPGHVVYIESVSGSKVNISEMNYNGGINKIHKRTVAASTFKYIY